MTRKAAKSTGVIAFDLGGTKLKAGLIHPSGKILSVLTEKAHIPEGPEAVVLQFARMVEQLQRQNPQIRILSKMGVASAGPIDPISGNLMDPTNFRLRNGKRWGVYPLKKILEKKIQKKIWIDNDAACAVQGEQWKGGGIRCENLAILTLGTGLGTAFICNGDLVRSGRHLHTEAGHIALSYEDPSAVCGCGNLGCAEAYLSATGFARRFSKRAKKTFTPREIVALAKNKNPMARQAFTEYGNYLARTVHDFCVVFGSEKVALAGGFAESHPYFLKTCQKELKRLLKNRRIGIDLLPEVYVSPLGSNAPLIGAACGALKA